MLSVTTSQALCPVLSIPRVPWGQFLRSLPTLPPPVLPQTRTQRCREMRLCAVLSGTLWAELILGKSPLGVSSTNLAVRTDVGVMDRVTSPTRSCHPVTGRGTALRGAQPGWDAARSPRGFIFAPSSHPDQSSRALRTDGPRAVFVSFGRSLEAIWALCGALIVWGRGHCDVSI